MIEDIEKIVDAIWKCGAIEAGRYRHGTPTYQGEELPHTVKARFTQQICQLFPTKWNCPKSCRFLIPSCGDSPNADMGGCAIEDKLPEGITLDPDDRLPRCPFYEPNLVNRG